MIPLKKFGRTDHMSTRTLFGAASLGKVSQKEADETLDLILKYGINHIDTAASYGDAELRIGPWMQNHRKDFFLATKTEKRTYQEAKEELYRSLEKLQTDHVDLWQMHVLIDPDEWQTAFGPGGALEAFIEAKEKGLVRYLGVTGHGLTAPIMHLKSLEQYDFDAVLLPYNFIMMQNPNYAENFEKLINYCKDKNIAVQTIKSLCKGPLESKDNRYATWYEPLTNQRAIENTVNWVLGNPDVFLNTVGDIYLLPNVLEAASNLSERPSDEMMHQDLKDFNITPLFT